jgi:acyl transferase domain-containing protein
LNQTWLAQPALFVVEYALAKLWLSWGISPQAMIGHSIGEYVAACLAEVFSLDDALMLIAWRGRLMQKMPRGAMLAVALAEQPLQSLLTPPLELAAVNAPHSCVVSGPTQDIEAFERTLRERNIACQRLHTSHAFHSSMTESIMDEFTRIVRGVPMRRPTVPYISNLTGSWTTEQDVVDPTYWSRHLRHTVRFGDGIAMLTRETPALLIEVGPGRTLSTLARHYEQAIPLTSLRHPQQQGSDVASMLTTLGQLWLHGVPLHWSSLYTQQRRRRLPLPVYPFERQRYWIEEQSPKQKETATPDGSATGSPEQTEAPMLYQRLAQSTPYIAPATETEQKLVSIWQEVLGIAQVSTRDSFFDLGGDSLQILQMNARIRETFPVEVTLHDLLLLQSHSIVHMAELIDQKMRARTINQ